MLDIIPIVCYNKSTKDKEVYIMSILFWFCFVFVCGMMCCRFVECFKYKMDNHNIFLMVEYALELMAFAYILHILAR